jgi:hypothetical protein
MGALMSLFFALPSTDGDWDVGVIPGLKPPAGVVSEHRCGDVYLLVWKVWFAVVTKRVILTVLFMRRTGPHNSKKGELT